MRFGVDLDVSEGLQRSLDLAVAAESLGYDSVAVSEHHGSTTGIPSPLLLLGAAACRTRSLNLVAHVVLLPLHHPVLVAEQAALVQALSEGRLVVGVALGYAPGDFAAFGVDRAERAGRMDEALPLLRQLWQDPSVSHDGTYWRGVRATVRPLLESRPPPPLWGGGWADSAIMRLSRHVDAWVAGAMVDAAVLSDRYGFFRSAITAARGVEPAGFPVSREMFCARTNAGAAAAGGAAVYRLYKDTFMAWGHPLLREAERRMGYDDLARDRFVIGDPAACVDAVARLASIGVTEISFRFRAPGIPWDDAMASLRLFSEQVMPHFTT